MAMHRPDHLVRVGNAFAQLPDTLRILLRHVVADGVGNIDGGSAFLDHCLNDAAEEIKFGASCIFTGKFDIVDSIARKTHCVLRRDEDVIRRHAQLFFHVDRAGRDEGVNAPCPGRLDRIERARDILVEGTAQACHRGILDGFCHRLDGLKIAVRRGREARFNHIHAHPFKLTGNPQLFLLGHGGAWALFAVTQGGIENDQMFLGHGYLLTKTKKQLTAPRGAGTMNYRIVGGGVFSARGAAAEAASRAAADAQTARPRRQEIVRKR